MTIEDQNELMLKTLQEIANYSQPEDIEDGDFGVDRDEAIEMAYSNVISTATYTLSTIASSKSKKSN